MIYFAKLLLKGKRIAKFIETERVCIADTAEQQVIGNPTQCNMPNTC